MSARDLIRFAVDKAHNISLAASKRAKRVRTASEFDVARLVPTMRSPIVPSASYSWDLTDIMQARDQQMLGQFALPCELAKSMRTNSALYSAWANRLAPQRRLGIKMFEGSGTKAKLACGEGEALFGQRGTALHPDTMSDVVADLAEHGLAIGINTWTPRADGSRIDVEMKVWPLRYAWYNTAARCLFTRIDPFPMLDVSAYGADSMPADTYGNPQVRSNIVPIVHGDGRWTVFSKHAEMPWTKDAVLLATSMIWGAIAFADRDWSKGATSHGSAKVVGELPEGFDLNTEGPEVQAFMTLLADIACGENPYGLKPFGSKVEILANPSMMWSVFKELVDNKTKAAHRCWTGTDAALGSQGGAPGIDVAALFGVSENIVSGDLEAIERGHFEGVSQPWAAINHGSSECAPRREYVVPDSDAAQVAKAKGEAQTAYVAALTSLQSAQIQVTQQMSDDLAGAYGAKAITIAAVASVVAPAASTTPAPLSVVR